MEAAENSVEVKKVYILYFLCRKGRIEDPQGHLIVRVQHHTSGIRLQDVKKWLGELRGKDMPDSFAWSNKRKHMEGYVWQDLLDEDLIMPGHNDEYVLKGSEISQLTSIQEDTKQTRRKSTGEIEEVLPESTLPVDFIMTVAAEKSSKQETKKAGESYLSLYLNNIFNKKTKKMTTSAITAGNAKSFSTQTEMSSALKTKGHANVKKIRNLITCRTTETNNSIVIPSVNRNRSHKFSLKNYSNEAMNEIQNEARNCGLQRRIKSGKGMMVIPKRSYPAALPANNATAESIYRQSVYAYLMTQ